MVETEAGRGEVYADDPQIGGYDVISLRENFSALEYAKAIKLAEKEKYDALIIDSGSHEWSGVGGVLDQAAKKAEAGAKGVLVWQQAKIQHKREFMLRLMQTPIPLVILCLRARFPMVEKPGRDGKKEWTRSDTLDPDQADDILFEMMVHGWIDPLHRFRQTKITTPALGNVFVDGELITIETGRRLAQWAQEPTAPAVSTLAPQPQDTAGTPIPDESNILTDWDIKLAAEANEGMDALQDLWETIPQKYRTTLKAALDRRHKPRAQEVDAVRDAAQAAEQELPL
jgi:hypothetical protein